MMYKKVYTSILSQFEKRSQMTSLCESQAFFELESGRLIEVTKESQGIEESKKFYSCRLHCNEDEYISGFYDKSLGIIKTYTTKNLKEVELLMGIYEIVKADNILTNQVLLDKEKIMDKERVAQIKDMYKQGMVVELIYMDDFQAPKPKTKGIVKGVDDAGQIHVNWNNGSSLALIPELDKFRIIS